MVLLGVTGVAVLAVVWLSLPGSAPAAGEVAREVSVQVYQALRQDDDRGLARAQESLRRSVHRDLLGKHIPGLLRVVTALRGTPRSCDPQAGSAFRRGICQMRRCEFRRALLTLAAVRDEHGGAAYRGVAAQLLRLDEARTTGRSVPARRAP